MVNFSVNLENNLSVWCDVTECDIWWQLAGILLEIAFLHVAK